jgi:riboflavin biosynthesis pyrimidine reductase
MGQIIVEQLVSADGFAADKDRGIGFFEQDHDLHELDHDQLTMLAAPWGTYAPAILERGDAASAVAAVRDRYRQDIIVWGSLTLTAALFRAGLVDRLRLRSVPRLIGAGIPVAPPDLAPTRLTLLRAQAYPKGHVVLDYRVER